MNLQLLENQAVISYEDLRDTITTIEAIRAQGNRRGKKWTELKKDLRIRRHV